MAKNIVVAYMIIAIGFISCNFSFQQTASCPTPSGYDLYNLTKPNYWQFNYTGSCFNDELANETCHFFFTFCRTLQNADDCSNSSVCQYGDNSNITELGHYNENPFESKDANGFFAIFQREKTIINKKTGKECKLSVKFEFDCKSTAYWTSEGDIGEAPAPTNYSVECNDTSCEIFFKFDYAGACYKIQTTTTATSSTTQMTTTVTETNPAPSKLCKPPSSDYNINILTKPPYWVFKIDSGCSILSNDSKTDKCTLNMAYCKPLENLVGCDGSSACIRYPNNLGGSIVVGNYSADPFTSTEFDGFFATYPLGQYIYNNLSKSFCYLSISMEFICDLDSNWQLDESPNAPGIGPIPIAFTSISNTSCQINVTVPYSGACIKQAKPENLSAGSVLLIFFFVTLFAYLIIGMSYNKFIDKQTGYNIIPHYRIWLTILVRAMEGLIFTWRLISCQNTQKEKSSYDNIE